MSYEKTKTESYELLGGINSKASAYINGPQEFRNLDNLSFQTPGALTKRQGSTLYVGATVIGAITSGVEYQKLNGNSFMIVTANTNAYSLTNTFTPIRTSLTSGGLFDFTVFIDRLFAANGSEFFKFDGTNSTNYSLPPGISGFGITGVVGGGLSGVFQVSYGYINNTGYVGPAAAGITISLNGITFGTLRYLGLTTPTGYGISSIQLYQTTPGGADLTGTTQALVGTTTVDINASFMLTTRLANFNLFFTMAPKYMEIYNNQLFMAGFSNSLSTAFWSDIGQPESIDPTFNAEFRTNDGDKITGLKSYNGSLIVTKERSFHRVTGDDPSNFLFQEISDQYGCISNRAMVVFENLLWFLDSKGVIQYNGANIDIVSTKIEPIIQTINVPAARENAVAVHVRKNNEVWFAVPCNGATMNNTILVYDYVASAWTKYSGLNMSSLWIAQGTQSEKVPFFGGYTGSVFNFNASLMGDNGSAITCLIDSRFYAVTGQTTERQFRRFYLDLDPVVGVTQALTVNFRTNYGTTIQISRTMYQNPFQSRIDFGLSARSIQAEVFHASASLPLKINGYTFESRFQRNV